MMHQQKIIQTKDCFVVFVGISS